MPSTRGFSDRFEVMVSRPKAMALSKLDATARREPPAILFHVDSEWGRRET
jgi:hypothetical protein